MINTSGKKKRVLPEQGPHPLDDNWAYSHGAGAGNLLFIAGQVSFDNNLRLIGVASPVEQARQVWKNVQKVVEAAGGKITDVVSVTSFIEDSSYIEDIHGVRREFFPHGDYPASTDVIVAKSSMPGILVEMQAIAIIGCS